MAQFPPSRYSDHELPGVVADVCREANPDDPQAVSQSHFDTSREDAGHPLAPSAKRICVRLRLPWDELKAFALDPTRSVDRTVGTRVGKKDEPWITAEFCIDALRSAARRIDPDRALTRALYEVEVDEMLAADRRRHVHGRRLTMPTVGQIELRLGRWPKALKRAGLKLPKTTRSASGVPWIDGIEMCLEATGCLPGSATLETFFEINDISLTRGRGISYPKELAKLRLRRAAEGKWTPARYTSPKQRPDLLKVVPGLTGPKRRQLVYSDDRVVASLVEFVRDRRGRSQTQRDYNRWGTTHQGAASISLMTRKGRGGFTVFRERARRIVREEENRQRQALGEGRQCSKARTQPRGEHVHRLVALGQQTWS